LVSRSVFQMPFSQWIAKSNRYIANPVLGLLAGKIGPLAVLEHTGRRSGKRRTIPIMAFRKTDGVVIALTYGPKTDWVRNVLAAGSTAITVRQQRYELNDPVLFEAEPASVGLPAPVVFFLKQLGVRDFLRLTDTSR
ncbi:MAG: nitroreductase family deazaflavin-dependent oxidoreductase, partial [Thermomicrobiales bacterium]